MLLFLFLPILKDEQLKILILLLPTIKMELASDLYETFEWKNLHPLIRADLATIVEGSRKGANIELFKLERQSASFFLEQKNSLDKWLKYSGFEYTNRRDDYYISSDKDLLYELSKGEIKPGEFLGYPECCIKNFEEGCKKYLEGKGKGPAVNFWLQAKKEKEKGELEPMLEYVLHMPCSTKCISSIEYTGLQVEAIKEKNTEAAKALREYNLRLMENFAKRF